MNYLTMAKIEIAGKPFVVCDCRLLENVEGCTVRFIKSMKNVEMIEKDNYKVVNPTDEFVSDFEKILVKISKGDESRYYRGDYSKYYITDYSKIMDMFDLLELKSF